MKKPKTESEACRLIHKIESQFHLVCHIWCTDDVIHQAEENETPITELEAQKATEQLRNSHDCNNGITWETLTAVIDSIISERPDPRITEFTARIDEATENYCKLVECGTDEMDKLAEEIRENINRMKQQRAEILCGLD